MSKSCTNINPLSREGTSQNGRDHDILDPENIRLHDLRAEDWLQFAERFAELVHFHPADDSGEASGDWLELFEGSSELTIPEEGENGAGETEPHLALFAAFLKLLEYPQKSLNDIPRRHLDYYYREILQIKEKPAVPDRVHLLFELAKNVPSEWIEEGARLSAGNDPDGNRLEYRITSPLAANQARVDSLRAVFTDSNQILRSAINARNPAGEEDDPDEDSAWRAFGNENWPEAPLGFFVASDLLKLSEGVRKVVLKISLSDGLEKTISETNVKVWFSGEEEWIVCEDVNVTAVTGSSTFQLVATLHADQDPVVGYGEEAHEAGLKCSRPVMKISFLNSSDYAVLSLARVEKTELSVDVSEMQTLRLQNEFGNLDPSKPFMPFGSAPKIGSNLKITCDEMAGKPVSEFGVDMKWLNLPVNFSDHYSHYVIEINKFRVQYIGVMIPTYNIVSIVGESHDKAPVYKKQVVNLSLEKKEPEKQPGKRNQFDEKLAEVKASKSSSDHRTRRVAVTRTETASESDSDSLRKEFEILISSPYTVNGKNFELFPEDEPEFKITSENGPKAVGNPQIELVLLETFYHELYQKLYVATTIQAAKNGDDISPDDLPNAPYTPLLDSLKLHYKAVQNEDFSTSDSTKDRAIELIHQHPFGTDRFKGSLPRLLPGYNSGSLFVGLSDAEPGSNISLLFEVDEGSENPETSEFQEGEEPKWSVLTKSGWTPVEGNGIVRNNTNNFLRSGIVEIQLPKSAVREHTLFGDDLHWLRITLDKPADAVADFINVHAQAAPAMLDAGDTSSEHLRRGLPSGSLSQLADRRSSVKAVEQPYPSFGGSSKEAPIDYYRRVSERLRHKNRAVSIWDYEHLVLEQFPGIYKVKCLNHTKQMDHTTDGLAPGSVTLVLIPNLQEGGRYLPRASRDLLDRVKQFLSGKISPHVSLRVVNPEYESVNFRLDAAFRDGLDFNHFRDQTETDLKKLLTPWMYDRSAEVRFDESFNVFEIIHYLENLEYIDYIENFSMDHEFAGGQELKKDHIRPSGPVSILVSGEMKIERATDCN